MKFSNGFMYPRVLRGRLLRLRAMAASVSAVWTNMSVPWGGMTGLVGFKDSRDGLAGAGNPQSE